MPERGRGGVYRLSIAPIREAAIEDRGGSIGLGREWGKCEGQKANEQPGRKKGNGLRGRCWKKT